MKLIRIFHSHFWIYTSKYRLKDRYNKNAVARNFEIDLYIMNAR